MKLSIDLKYDETKRLFNESLKLILILVGKCVRFVRHILILQQRKIPNLKANRETDDFDIFLSSV